ncbi:hypothetical protein DQ241_06010 [Blastococcus sp. TF02A-30]|nr:hypothetical protein DQ241_06010 [Blastococcus sp. TF02A-30]
MRTARFRHRHSGRGILAAFARQPADFRSPATCVFAGQHTDSRVYTPKMPGEPMRVQPSRAKKPAESEA